MSLVIPIEIELSYLLCFESAIRDAHREHLKTGDYAPLGMAAQDALMQLDKDLLREVESS